MRCRPTSRSAMTSRSHRSPAGSRRCCVPRAVLVLTLEDMHWAGRSTQEFAVAVAATARGPLLLALTFRTDDLHRGHPFRRAVREIGRSSGSVRIDLGPLDRDAVTALVRTRTGGEDPELARSVLTRSEGNPLFVEELLAAGGDGLPEHLNDLLLARIDALSLPTRGLLRLASVDGIPPHPFFNTLVQLHR